jgi:hypothetical protein
VGVMLIVFSVLHYFDVQHTQAIMEAPLITPAVRLRIWSRGV